MPAEAQTKVEAQSEAEAKMVDLPSDGPSVDVELPTKKEKTINPEPEQTEVVVEENKNTASTEEMDDYGKKVQSRIDKLTKKLREAERREQAAVQYAQGVQEQAKTLQSRVGNLDRGYVLEYGNRVKAETEDAKKRLKEAMDAGDVNAQVEAQQDLARLAVENERVKATEAKREKAETPVSQPNTAQQYQQPRAPQPPAPPDPKAEDWAEKNEWFGKDEPMTLTSFSIHRKLMEEGFDPQSDSYYSEIDKRMRDTFPHKFDKQVSPTQTVASVNRGSQPIARKGTVRLTPSQVAIAKKLGVPLSEYAKYVKE
tara:strand:- start:166 stop:1101 length:936 start_codon:yes stop_codon:yes gene_type:complete